jgi:hypothetical protein
VEPKTDGKGDGKGKGRSNSKSRTWSVDEGFPLGLAERAVAQLSCPRHRQASHDAQGFTVIGGHRPSHAEASDRCRD